MPAAVARPAVSAVLGVVAMLATAAGLTACTDRGAAPPGAVGPSSPAPAEGRLHFIWEEAVPVPGAARPVVDAAREWTHAYYLWDTDPTTLPPYLVEHSGARLLDQIRSASRTAPQAIGAVRVTLIEVRVDGTTASLIVCDDMRDRRTISSDASPDAGQRSDPDGYVTGHRLRLGWAAAGEWTVEDNAWTRDVEDRCRPAASAAPPSGPVRG